MPKIAKYKGFIIFMWMFDLNERRHLHIIKNSNYSVLKGGDLI